MAVTAVAPPPTKVVEVMRSSASSSPSTPSNSATKIIQQRLDDYNARVTGISRLDRERTIPALALRAYHLPNNGWYEDWLQYFQNNHPLLGICCHHKLHPVRFRMRLVILIGSVVFGLAVTNIIWLWFHFGSDETYFVVSFGNNSTADNNNYNTNSSTNVTITTSDNSYQVTKGMIVLWTVGGGLHAVFDTTVWFLTACVCCLPGQPLGHLEKCRRLGSYFVVMAVVLCAALSTFVVVIRAVVGQQEKNLASSSGVDNNNNMTDVSLGDLPTAIDINEATEPSAYGFLIGYSVELALAFFVYYPIFATILFSGILGCGKVPILGGRPYEIAREQQLLEAEQRQRNSSPPV